MERRRAYRRRGCVSGREGDMIRYRKRTALRQAIREKSKGQSLTHPEAKPQIAIHTSPHKS